MVKVYPYKNRNGKISPKIFVLKIGYMKMNISIIHIRKLLKELLKILKSERR